MRVVATVSNKDNLCKYCQMQFSNCPKAEYIKFGKGIGSDNVIACSEYACRKYFNSFPIVGKPELGVFQSRRNRRGKNE